MISHARAFYQPTKKKHNTNNAPSSPPKHTIRSRFTCPRTMPTNACMHAHTTHMHVRKCPLLYLSHPGTGANAFPLCRFSFCPQRARTRGKGTEEVLTGRLHYGSGSITNEHRSRRLAASPQLKYRTTPPHPHSHHNIYNVMLCCMV